MLRKLLIPAALLLAAAPRPVAAQAVQLPLPLQAGDRLQLQAPTTSGGRVHARLVEFHPEWLSFRMEGDVDQVWTRRIQFVDTLVVSEGRSRWRSARWGMVWGAYVGGAAGGIAGPLAARSIHRSVGQSSALLGAGVGLAGAGVGALIGAVIAPERWKVYRFVRTTP